MEESQNRLIKQVPALQTGTVWRDAHTTEKLHDGELQAAVLAEQIGIGFSIPASWYFDILAMLEIASYKAVPPASVREFSAEVREMLSELYGAPEANQRIINAVAKNLLKIE